MFTSNLKPDTATMVGLATAGAVYGIYSQSLPNLTDVRVSPTHDTNIESARKQAAWKSAALIGLVFLVARDLNSYVISGVALVGIDYMYKHNNAVNPATGKVDTSGNGRTIAPGLSTEYPVPDYNVADDFSQ